MGFLRNLLLQHRGSVGEAKIAKKLNIMDFWGYDGKCFRNLYVPKENGTTSEIDLVYVTVKGVFIIESKNYSGYIFGDDNNQNWTSALYAGKTWYGGKKVNKYHFYNPVLQNCYHIAALEDYLDKDLQVCSIVVFGDDCELKNISISRPYTYLCNARDLRKTIKWIWKNTPNVYSTEEQSWICSRLLPLTIAPAQVKATHIYDIENMKNSLTCPVCGKKLVLRTAKSGMYRGWSFYGCSGYPRCRYIKNI